MFADKHTIRFLQSCLEAGTDVVAITVLATEGSTYRKSGAMMFVAADGRFHGVVSGGCFEEEMLHCSREVLDSGRGKRIIHDLRITDDAVESWGQGVGCNGLMEFWMDPYYACANYGILGTALDAARQHEDRVLVRNLENPADSELRNDLPEGEIAYRKDEATFSQRIRSPFRLLILGAGPGCEPLAAIADTLGWTTTVADLQRSRLARIHHADHIEALTQESGAVPLLRGCDGVVIMSHAFNSDAAYLDAALETGVGYIGVMGPKKRTGMLLQSLERDGSSAIHSPVGLDLGGKDPAAIALAIAAQIEAHRHGKVD